MGGKGLDPINKFDAAIAHFETMYNGDFYNSVQ